MASRVSTYYTGIISGNCKCVKVHTLTIKFDAAILLDHRIASRLAILLAKAAAPLHQDL